MNSDFIITCPHCNDPIVIEKVNCGIFRHGVYILTKDPIPPHSPKHICDALLEKGLIYGCGKPFRIEVREGEVTVTICDYI